ncbi:MAG: hypothetical protein AAF438_04295 [Pseudomonadota bacterium]
MKTLVATIALIALSGCTANPGISSLDSHAKHAASSNLPSSIEHIQGQILVRFNDDVASAQVSRIIKQLECHILTRYNDSQLFHLELPEGLSVTQAVREFASLEEVAFAEPNYVLGTEPYEI